MQDTIICPHCQKTIPLTQALSHELNEKYKNQMEEERKKNRVIMQEWQQKQLLKIQEERERVAKESVQKAKELEEQLRLKVTKDMELKLLDTKNETEELKKEKELLTQQILETNKLIRQLKSENEQKQLELEKRLAEEQEKIRVQEQQRSEEIYKLKILEQEKKLNDALKLAEEYRHKLEQGSQQLQGEILELEIENMLRSEFPFDEIKPVAKGVRGGDIMQVVKNSAGKTCGTIIWETKRTRAWSSEWIMKLKQDQRQLKAELAVIITQAMPQSIKRFGWLDGVCIGDYDCIIGIAHALRNQLLEVAMLKSSFDGKNDKMEILYNYLTSTEFRQRVEAILEAYSSIQEDIEKEKRWFTAKWAKQEKNLRKVIDNTVGMHGDLQSIMGNALNEVKGLEMLPSDTVTTSNGDLQTDKNTLF